MPPTGVPSVAPSAAPSAAPTRAPTHAPTGVPSAAPTTAPTHAPTAAPTAAPTTTFYYSFVTNSAVADGNLGGLAGADATCTAAGQASSISAVAAVPAWTAWLSSATSDARDRIFNTAQDYRLTDGTTVLANGITDLLDGDIDVTTIFDQNGATPPANALYTGTYANGTYTTDSGVTNCDDWTSNSAVPGAWVGVPSFGGSGWTYGAALLSACSNANFYRLLCFANSLS